MCMKHKVKWLVKQDKNDSKISNETKHKKWKENACKPMLFTKQESNQMDLN